MAVARGALVEAQRRCDMSELMRERPSAVPHDGAAARHELVILAAFLGGSVDPFPRRTRSRTSRRCSSDSRVSSLTKRTPTRRPYEGDLQLHKDVIEELRWDPR